MPDEPPIGPFVFRFPASSSETCTFRIEESSDIQSWTECRLPEPDGAWRLDADGLWRRESPGGGWMRLKIVPPPRRGGEGGVQGGGE